MSESIIDDIDTTLTGNATIKVIGVGGGGGNAIQEMINADLVGVHFICANTDLQALSKNSAKTKIQLGEKQTRGLGAGANPAIGREAAMESINAIKDAIGDADMIFITAGMGGGTGTGAAPVIAQTAKDLGALTVGVVTKPFTFEGSRRLKIAEGGLEELKKHVDCLIIIPNDRLYSIAPRNTPIHVMFQKANEVLLNGVRGISDVIKRDGFINVDFADVRTIMSESGMALMGTGYASGENRAHEATQMAIESPLLENVSLESAKAILYNITMSREKSATMEEMEEIGYMISESVAKDANINIIFGIVYDESMGDTLQVTVIATGIQPMEHEEEEVFYNNQTTQIQTQFKQPNVQKFKPQIKNESPVIFEDFETPTINRIRRKHAQEQGHEEPPAPRRPELPSRRKKSIPGQDEYIFDESEMDIPSWIRNAAD